MHQLFPENQDPKPEPPPEPELRPVTAYFDAEHFAMLNELRAEDVGLTMSEVVRQCVKLGHKRMRDKKLAAAPKV